MCAILDANVLGEVFGESPSAAGGKFREWLTWRGKLVTGGKNGNELDSPRFRQWARRPAFRAV